MKGKYFASHCYLVLIPYCYTPPLAAPWSKTVNLFNSDNIDNNFLKIQVQLLKFNRVKFRVSGPLH